MFKMGDRYHHVSFGAYCWIVYSDARGINDASEINSHNRILYTRLRAMLVDLT